MQPGQKKGKSWGFITLERVDLSDQQSRGLKTLEGSLTCSSSSSMSSRIPLKWQAEKKKLPCGSFVHQRQPTSHYEYDQSAYLTISFFFFLFSKGTVGFLFLFTFFSWRNLNDKVWVKFNSFWQLKPHLKLNEILIQLWAISFFLLKLFYLMPNT